VVGSQNQGDNKPKTNLSNPTQLILNWTITKTFKNEDILVESMRKKSG
jgi:hypothetical protein